MERESPCRGHFPCILISIELEIAMEYYRKIEWMLLSPTSPLVEKDFEEVVKTTKIGKIRYVETRMLK
jgi:ERCC4-related helicase